MKRTFSLLLTLAAILALLFALGGTAFADSNLTTGEYYELHVADVHPVDFAMFLGGAAPDGMEFTATESKILLIGTPTTPGTGTYTCRWTENSSQGGGGRSASITVTVVAPPTPVPPTAPPPTAKPVDPTAKPVDPTAKPVDPTAKPVDPTAAPTAPKVTKSPTSESVNEGGSCLFVARADGATSYTWYCTMNGKTYSMSEAASQFSGLSVSGDGTERLSLSNIPKSMNGAGFYCTFSNAYGSSSSDSATTYVSEKSAPTAKPTEKPDEPTATPDPTPTPEPDHEHKYSPDWKHDNDKHWHECECGDRQDEAAHEVTSWATSDDGSKLGVCTVCGAAVTKAAEPVTPTPVPEKKGLNSNAVLLLILIVVIVLLIAAGVFLLLRMKSKNTVSAAKPVYRESRREPETYGDEALKPEKPDYNPRHDGIHDDEDRAEYYREMLEDYENRN